LPQPRTQPSGADAAPTAAGASLKERLDAYERGLIVAALDEARGNRTHAARALGLNRGTLHSKLNKYGLAGPEDADEQAPADA
jgi:DNA-binding NtrC family response regulator